ncbi:hypothetical protein BJ742DRAFT_782714 [Cladochytrium replicatum]|nr:hypothetical protein BJ742DRAFT_782714 [Cladochytrium replicatum]
MRSTVSQMHPDCYHLLSNRIVDPRLRARLGVEPSHNPRLIRQPTSHQNNNPPLHSLDNDPFLIPHPFARPTPHSSESLARYIDELKSQKFDPTGALAALMVRHAERNEGVRRKATSEALNVKEDAARYADLAPIPTQRERPEPFIRAKKSTSKQWLDAQSNQPDFSSMLKPTQPEPDLSITAVPSREALFKRRTLESLLDESRSMKLVDVGALEFQRQVRAQVPQRRDKRRLRKPEEPLEE